MKNEEYKKLSIKEFTKAAGRYESSHAGIYEMCKKDYPDILEELEKEPFRDLLDAGCGPAPMISLLAEKYPDRHYTGLDLTPAMIEQAKKKNISNATFVVGDCENFPFENDSFDAIICSMSFHHYPNPQAFFDSVKRCLRPNGRLVLRDVTSDSKVLVWLMNTLEMPLANICGHGDVQVPTRDVVIKCCKKAGLKVEKFEIRKGMRMHCVVRKPMGKAMEMKDKYLRETRMVDFSNPAIQKLIQNMKWKEMGEFERIKAIYNYVRDDVLFGYNIDDGISASKVLADGYGQCNTKGTLFMALLRACNIPCRVHGFTIDKSLQKGAMTGFVYRNAPKNIFHSWVEINFENQWYELEAFILDKTYIKKLQEQNSECTGAFCGYGVAVKDFRKLIIEFDRNNTYIQSEGINQDFGVYDCPDELLKEHHQEISAFKAFVYRHIGRHLMNRNVRKIRER